MKSKVVPFQSSKTLATKLVACPHCQTKIKWSGDNPYRPFCSKRCKLIDLGEWVSEEHSIPGSPVDEDHL